MREQAWEVLIGMEKIRMHKSLCILKHRKMQDYSAFVSKEKSSQERIQGILVTDS